MLIRTLTLHRAATIALAAIALLAAWAPRAHAGSYVVTACGAAPGGVNNSWGAIANHGNVTAYGTACAPISGGLIARASANNSSAPAGAIASWTITRPNPETVITGVDLSGEIYRLGGDSFNSWGVGLSDNTGAFLWGDTSNSFLHVGTSSGAYIPIGVDGRISLTMGVRCVNPAGCTTASGGDATQNYSRARTALFGARVTFGNWVAPSIGGRRGALWTTNGWVGGTQQAGFDSSDEVGVQRIALAVDGAEQASDSSCDFTFTVPCPISRTLDASFNTSGFADGVHTLWFRSTDSAGNVATDSRWIYVDNTAPAAPGTPSLAGAASTVWRTVNGFTLNYSNPSTGGGSDNIASDVQICPADEQGTTQTTSCTIVSRGAASGSNTFDVPRAGVWRARVRVHDHLYAGAWSEWGPVLRFDDVVPGRADLQIYNGWVSREEIASGLAIEPRANDPVPASGFAGYATTTDGTNPGITANLPTRADGRGRLGLVGLPDGIYSVKARAVSLAGLAATDANIRASTLRIDTTAPTLVVDGAPAQGSTVNRPTLLAARASDSLSGMTPAATDDALTTGAYLAYAVDGEQEHRVRGGSVRVGIRDGRHTVRLSAVDVAGNRSADQHFTFTQDTAPPSGGLVPADPNDPRRITFAVSEDCIASATIELRSAGSDEWRPLETQVGERAATARVPDDIWNERVPYTVRAQVTDCAGNGATLDQWYGGAADGHRIDTITPQQRAVVRLSIAFSEPALSKRCVTISKPRLVRTRTGRTRIVRHEVKVCPPASKSATTSAKKVYSRTREVYGAVTDVAGNPLVNREVHVQTQLRSTGSRWRTVRVARTNSKGTIRSLVRKFTSLRVRLVAPRDELYDAGTSGVLTTNVSARSTIHAGARRLRNGQVLRLSGRVLGGHVPQNGMQIALYGFSPSKRQWLPVRTTVEVDPRGAWTALYRFTATRASATFRFRMRIAERPNFPFATGYSKTVRVTVRP